MLINEISQEDCRSILAQAAFGRLGCSLDDQPYVVPIYFVYEADYFYVLSTLGQKIEWMRKNPRVCVEFDEITSETNWVSIIANGSYQELSEPEYIDERKHARELLARRIRWWQTALAERQLKSGDELIEPLLFRVHSESLSGLRCCA